MSYILPFNLISNKDLSPSEKLTLIGIDMTKAINEDGSILINLGSIEEYTNVSNRNIRRNLKSFADNEILLPMDPEETGKYRKLIPQDKYDKLMYRHEDIHRSDSSNTKEQALDKLSSKELIDSIPTKEADVVTLTMDMIENGASLNDEFTSELINGTNKYCWVPVTFRLVDKEHKTHGALMSDGKYIIKNSILAKLESMEEG